MIHFKNRNAMLSEVLAGVTDGHTCWDLVIPPCCGDETIPQELKARLVAHPSRPLVASVAADGLTSAWDLVTQMAEAWLPTLDGTVDKSEEQPRRALTRILSASDHHRPRVLICYEFHKMLSVLDEQILVALRDAETMQAMRTVTISPYPLKWIKELWRKEGRLLNVSRYGDTHRRQDVEIYSDAELLDLCEHEGLPKGIAKVLLEVSGGLPQPLNALIGNWRGLGEPRLTPAVQERLKTVAKDGMTRLVEKVDIDSKPRFLDMLVKMHLGIDADVMAADVGRFHPWGHVLLAEGGLRCDCLGETALELQLERSFSSQKGNADLGWFVMKAREYYDLGQYDLVRRVLGSFGRPNMPVDLELLSRNAEIMEALYLGNRPDSGGGPSIDSDWRRVVNLVAGAKEVALSKMRESEGKSCLLNRYSELSLLAKGIISGIAQDNRRPVYALAGLRGDCEDRSAALSLLLLQADFGRRTRGHASACKLVLDLPEQLVAVWGKWACGVNMTKAVVTNETKAVWDIVVNAWPEHRGELRMPRDGLPFGSVGVFMYYLYGLGKCGSGQCESPWQSIVDVERDLGVFDLRNDLAHAVASMNIGVRRRFFEFIDCWLSRIQRDIAGVKDLARKVYATISPL